MKLEFIHAPKGKKQVEGLLLMVQIQPSARANKIVGVFDGRLKIQLTAAPEDGKANKALIDFLSKLIKIPKSQIQIQRGFTSRRKDLLVLGADETHFTSLKLDG